MKSTSKISEELERIDSTFTGGIVMAKTAEPSGPLPSASVGTGSKSTFSTMSSTGRSIAGLPTAFARCLSMSPSLAHKT